MLYKCSCVKPITCLTHAPVDDFFWLAIVTACVLQTRIYLAGEWALSWLSVSLYVLQAGYNLLYGCWKYSWDADCELFLKILRGEVKEDVYVEQIQLQVLCMTTLPAGVTTLGCL